MGGQRGTQHAKRYSMRAVEGEMTALKSTQPRYRNEDRVKELVLIRESILSKRFKSGWIQCEFQDLPCGTVFRCDVNLGKWVMPQEFVLMKLSSGAGAVILSSGMDQGTLVHLDINRVVTTRKPSRKLVSDVPVMQTEEVEE
jgi:hypothetical protein